MNSMEFMSRSTAKPIASPITVPIPTSLGSTVGVMKATRVRSFRVQSGTGSASCPVPAQLPTCELNHSAFNHLYFVATTGIRVRAGISVGPWRAQHLVPPSANLR